MPSSFTIAANADPPAIIDLNPQRFRGPAAWRLYHAGVLPFFDVTLANDADEAGFRFRGTSSRFSNVLLARIESVAQTIRRRAMVPQAATSFFYVCLQISGHNLGHCGEMPLAVAPGDILLFNDCNEFVSQLSAFEVLVLRVPIEHLAQSFGQSTFTARVLSAASGFAQLIGRALETFAGASGRLGPAEMDVALDAILVLVAGALTLAVGAGTAMRDTSTSQIRDAAITFIQRNISQNDLSPATIAAHIKTSRSNLYRAFKTIGGVRETVLRLRLDGCLRLILSGGAAHRSLGSIAFAHGFRSEAHFSRSFKARFGDTPRRFVEMIEKKQHGWLDEQARSAGFQIPNAAKID